MPAPAAERMSRLIGRLTRLGFKVVSLRLSDEQEAGLTSRPKTVQGQDVMWRFRIPDEQMSADGRQYASFIGIVISRLLGGPKS